MSDFELNNNTGAWFPANKVYQACMQSLTQTNKNFQDHLEREIQEKMKPGWFRTRSREQALASLKHVYDGIAGISDYDLIQFRYEECAKQIRKIAEVALHLNPTDKMFISAEDFDLISDFYQREATTSEMLKEE